MRSICLLLIEIILCKLKQQLCQCLRISFGRNVIDRQFAIASSFGLDVVRDLGEDGRKGK